MTNAKVIRYHLEEFRTVLRLAFDQETWDAQRTELSNHPELPVSPGDVSGSVTAVMFHPDDRPDLNPKRIQHLVIYIGLWDGLRSRRGGDTGDLVGTVAHEAVHVVQWIMEFIGEDAHRQHRLNEVEGYLAGFVARWVWDHLP